MPSGRSRRSGGGSLVGTGGKGSARRRTARRPAAGAPRRRFQDPPPRPASEAGGEGRRQARKLQTHQVSGGHSWQWGTLFFLSTSESRVSPLMGKSVPRQPAMPCNVHLESLLFPRDVHLALLPSLGGSDDPLPLHFLDDARRAVETDLQAALQEGDG